MHGPSTFYTYTCILTFPSLFPSIQWESCPSSCQMLTPAAPVGCRTLSPFWGLLSDLCFFSSLLTPFHQCLNKLNSFLSGKKKKKAFLNPVFLGSYYSVVHLPTWVNSLTGLSPVAVYVLFSQFNSQFTVTSL